MVLFICEHGVVHLLQRLVDFDSQNTFKGSENQLRGGVLNDNRYIEASLGFGWRIHCCVEVTESSTISLVSNFREDTFENFIQVMFSLLMSLVLVVALVVVSLS